MPLPEFLRKIRECVGNDMIVLPSAAAAAFDSQGRLFLIQESDYGQWALPGGCVDPLERPASTIVREVWEETRLMVEPERILGVYGGPEFVTIYRNGDQVSYVMTVFVCRVTGGQPQADQEEVIDAGFFTAGQVAELNLRPWMHHVLPSIWRARAEAHFHGPAWSPGVSSQAPEKLPNP